MMHYYKFNKQEWILVAVEHNTSDSDAEIEFWLSHSMSDKDINNNFLKKKTILIKNYV